MFDQPLLAIFENAIQQNGLPVRFTANVGPTAAQTRRRSRTRSARLLRRARAIFATDPDFADRADVPEQHADRSAARQRLRRAGGLRLREGPPPAGRHEHQPDQSRRARWPTALRYSAARSTPTTRLDPRFNQINVVQSIGDSDYKALTLNLSKRFTKGYQFDLTYTLGKGEDNAPITSALAVQGDDGRSDPTNLDRDLGPERARSAPLVRRQHRRHAGVARRQPLLRALLNNNQIGILLQFNSGLPFNVRSNLDLNDDGILADRPLAIGRNSVYLPARYNTDLRYSRFVPIVGRYRGRGRRRVQEPVQRGADVGRQPHRHHERRRRPGSDAAGRPATASRRPPATSSGSSSWDSSCRSDCGPCRPHLRFRIGH